MDRPARHLVFLSVGFALLVTGSQGCFGNGKGGFIMIGDDVPVVEECDPGLQNCESPDKCTPYSRTEGYCCVDANRCAPSDWDQQLGEACTRTQYNDNCARGLFCLAETSGQTGAGVCMQLCSPGDDVTCRGGVCVPYDDGFLPLCQDICDPLAPSCEAGFGCHALIGFGEFVCTKSGSGTKGDRCITIAGCQSGLLCLDGAQQKSCGHESCCTPVCDIQGDGSECAEQEMCRSPWPSGRAPAQYDSVGACLSVQTG